MILLARVILRTRCVLMVLRTKHVSLFPENVNEEASGEHFPHVDSDEAERVAP